MKNYYYLKLSILIFLENIAVLCNVYTSIYIIIFNNILIMYLVWNTWLENNFIKNNFD